MPAAFSPIMNYVTLAGTYIYMYIYSLSITWNTQFVRIFLSVEKPH